MPELLAPAAPSEVWKRVTAPRPRAQLQLMPGVRAHLLCKRVARISLPDLDRLGYRYLVQS